MNKKSVILVMISHVLVGAIGVLLAWEGGEGMRKSSTQDESTANSQVRSGQSASDSRGKSSSYRPTKEWHGSEYARAWKAMRFAKFSTPDRLKAQRELLKRWAEKDLSAAIDAALGEAWDDDGGKVFGGGTGPLMDVFSEAFAKNPDQSWEMIRNRQFGVGTGIVRGVWMKAVGAKDPVFLAARLGELSWRDQRAAVSICENAFDSEIGVNRAELFKMLASQPEDVVSTQQLSNFAMHDDLPESELKEEILRLAANDLRVAKVEAMSLGKFLTDKSPEEVAAAIRELPPELANEAIWSAFERVSQPERTLGLVDLLIAGNAWDKINQRETAARLQQIAGNGEAEQVADWALTLPVRGETSQLFHRSVATYLRKDMEGSRAWMTALPAGEWRDRAFGEYSQQALNAHNSPDASQWALDQIGDPAFKKEATAWRSQWEARSGRKGK